MASYICPSIRTYIDTQKNAKTWTTKQTVDGLTIDVALWLKPDDFPEETICLPAIGRFILDVTRWIASLRWSQPLSALKIKMSFSPYKKQWCPETTQEIDRCHMNSGETTSFGCAKRGSRAQKKAEIEIWRREDWHKVLIHELLHAFDWDRLIPIDLRHNQLKRVHEAEAIVEALANVFQCLLLFPNPSEFKEALRKERKHAIALAQNLQDRDWTTKETHVREYCFIKAALLCSEKSFQRFWSWLHCKSEKECQTLWTSVRDSCVSELTSILSLQRRFKSSSCISLRLVHHQLSLCPQAI
jgi:hypothetical protein